MIDIELNIVFRRDVISGFKPEVVERSRAKVLVGFVRLRHIVQVTVMDGTAEKTADIESIAGIDNIAEQRRVPSEVEIEVIGLARGIDRAADGRPGRSDVMEEIRRLEQQLADDVGAAFLGVAEKAHV